MLKYIRFDWMMKRLLRNKASHVILEGFLSVLLKRQIKITQILESESNQESAEQKFNRVDLLVEDDKKEKFLIEVQNDHELDYFHRMAYGASKIISDYMKLGATYDTIPKVFSVNVVYFSLGQGNGYAYHGTTRFWNMLDEKDELKLSKVQKSKFGKDEVSGIFPEYYILRVNKFDEEPDEDLKQWISFLKTGEIPDTFTAQGLPEAREILRVDSLSEEDRKAYYRYVETLGFNKSVFETSVQLGYSKGHEQGMAQGMTQGMAQGRAEGRAEGIAEGIAEGEKQKAIAMARLMKNDNQSVEKISLYTGLSPQEIEKL